VTEHSAEHGLRDRDEEHCACWEDGRGPCCDCGEPCPAEEDA
jgi:hypothetical protein